MAFFIIEKNGSNFLGGKDGSKDARTFTNHFDHARAIKDKADAQKLRAAIQKADKAGNYRLLSEVE